MPDKRYFDIKELKTVTLPSDYFECPICSGIEFVYDVNPEFLSGQSEREFKQRCVDCGNVYFSDKKYQEEQGRYILNSVKEDKEKAKAVKKEKKEIEEKARKTLQLKLTREKAIKTAKKNAEIKKQEELKKSNEEKRTTKK